MDAIDEDAVRTVRGLTGVQRVESLGPTEREALRARGTPGSAENRGIAEVLSRPRILCLFKDVRFRPPPEPTLLLVDDSGAVLGRELVAGDRPPADRRVAYLGKDFVLYAGARPRGAYHFLLPAVRFPELEAMSRLVRVVSASPDTPQDEYLRARFGVPPSPEFASVLVGYDVRNP